MDNYFIFNLALSFLVGGIWITTVTVVAESFGTKMGGFIGGLPSTALITFLFIGLSQSPEAASVATTSFPLTMGITGLFYVAYAFFIKKKFGLVKTLSVSIFLWFGLSLLVFLFDIKSFSLSLIIYLVILLFSFYAFEKLDIVSVEGAAIKHSFWPIIGRAIFSGSIITLGVLLSKTVGLVLGGILAAFPAAALSSLIILYRSKGADFSSAFIKIFMTTGLIIITLYGVVLRYAYPALGLLWGTIFSYIFSVLLACLVFQFLKRKA